MKKHKNILYGMVFILLVLQASSFVVISSQINKINNEVEKTRSNLSITIETLEKDFQGQLEEEKTFNQQNFNDISKALSQQQQAQSSFEQQIKLLKSGSGDFSSIIEDAVKGVVSVGTDRSAGSGFFVSEDGHVVTNQHVIANARRIDVLTYDKRILPAELLAYNTNSDLALLKVDGGPYNYLELADSDKLQVGQKVVAIGNPFGLSFTVTEGIISALHREGLNGLNEYAQTDVSLNPGNSGGPLIDKSGEVVGVNNFKVGGAESLGFALESNAVRATINRLANSTIIE